MKELHPSQVYNYVVDYAVLKITTTVIMSATVSLAVLSIAATPKDKPLLSAGTCGLSFLGEISKKRERSKKLTLGDIEETSHLGFKQLVASLTQIGSKITIQESIEGWQPEGLLDINDLAAMLNRLHGRIIGGSGTGKSVLAKGLVRLLQGQVKIYDVEATKRDWQGFEVVGKGENWDAIAKSMMSDLKMFCDRISNATADDNDAGWDLFKGQTCIKVVEEYPDCKDEVNSRCEPITKKGDYKGLADEWCQRLARRGRKPGLLLLLISQYDNVSAWGFEGKGNLTHCFHAIRLGKFAVDHASKLNDSKLVKWLQADLERRCMVDNEPCELPSRANLIMMGSGITQLEPAPVPKSLELNEYEQCILDWGKRHLGETLKARNLLQSSRLFQNMPPEDVRIIFSAMADKGIGEVVDKGDKLGWKLKS
jgi:hypothetical protein